MQKPTGIDTRMMVPVYGGIFFGICQLFLPWVRVPVLKSSRLPVAYPVFETGTGLQNLSGWLRSRSPETLNWSPLWMELTAGVLLVLTALACVLVFVRKSRSKVPVQVIFSLNFLFCLTQLLLLIPGNLRLNQLLGRPSDFLNLSARSILQPTSWLCAQVLICGGIVLFAGRLLNAPREKAPRKPHDARPERRMGKRTWLSLLLIAVAMPLVILFGIFFLGDRSNVFIGLCMICLAMIPFAMVFEDRRPQARELLLIAVLSGIAVVGRMAFFMIPQFKPVTAIVILAGIGLGAEAGFLTGMVSGFVSNFFFGQGPWTPWQMFAYGIIGFLAGLLLRRRSPLTDRRREKLYMLVLCLYGAFSAFFLYGLVLDLSSALQMTGNFSWQVLLAKIISGIPFNLIHALSTVVFLLFLARPMLQKLHRIQKKYGMLQR